MKPFFGEEQPTSYWHFVKEIEGVTGIIMVVLMAIAFTLATPWLRRGRLNLPNFLKKCTGFNAFWYSHHLFVIVYALLVIHGIRLYLTHEWYKKTVSTNANHPNKKILLLILQCHVHKVLHFACDRPGCIWQFLSHCMQVRGW